MSMVSVVLPVFQGEAFIAESVRSILDQSWRNLELIVVDDGSTDATPRIVEAVADDRLRYERLPRNLGSATATNKGYELARGDFIAHMDADDIAMPERLARQVAHLQRYRAVSVVGGGMFTFGAQSVAVRAPLGDGAIKAALLSGAGNLYNPTVMLRRSFIEAKGLRCDPSLRGAFDWGLWVEAMRQGATFANLDEPLLRYRVHPDQQSRDQSDLRAEMASIRLRVLECFCPILCADERRIVEPLLQWVSPPPLTVAEVQAGLALLDRLLPYRQPSKAGEDRHALAAYFERCRQRWCAALAGVTR